MSDLYESLYRYAHDEQASRPSFEELLAEARAGGGEVVVPVPTKTPRLLNWSREMEEEARAHGIVIYDSGSATQRSSGFTFWRLRSLVACPQTPDDLAHLLGTLLDHDPDHWHEQLRAFAAGWEPTTRGVSAAVDMHYLDLLSGRPVSSRKLPAPYVEDASTLTGVVVRAAEDELPLTLARADRVVSVRLADRDAERDRRALTRLLAEHPRNGREVDEALARLQRGERVVVHGNGMTLSALKTLALIDGLKLDRDEEVIHGEMLVSTTLWVVDLGT